MLTNFETIKARLGRLRELEQMEADGTMELLPKKEVLHLTREREKLERNLGGIRGMTKPPSALWVVDTVKEHIAVKEANRLSIPVVAVVDTNCDPDVIDYIIPGNDDAIRSGALLTKIVADACAEGYVQRAARSTEDVVAEQAAAVAAAVQAPAAAAKPAAEPLAEWEIALQQEEAARHAAEAGGVPAAEAEPAEDVAEASPDGSGPGDEAVEQPAAEPAVTDTGDTDTGDTDTGDTDTGDTDSGAPAEETEPSSQG
jgi:small subunit ribosomal protein S2